MLGLFEGDFEGDADGEELGPFDGDFDGDELGLFDGDCIDAHQNVVVVRKKYLNNRSVVNTVEGSKRSLLYSPHSVTCLGFSRDFLKVIQRAIYLDSLMGIELLVTSSGFSKAPSQK